MATHVQPEEAEVLVKPNITFCCDHALTLLRDETAVIAMTL